jgi:anti-sigma regulatory factor (Ser/Thr protein kinase)
MSCLKCRDAQTALPVTGPSAAQARAFTKATLTQWNLLSLEEVAVLLVSELAGNVIRHARNGDAMVLRLRAGDGWLRIEVQDDDAQLPSPRDPSMLDESGFGFVLIEALASKWGVHQAPGGKTVWAELATDTASAPQAAPQ